MGWPELVAAAQQPEAEPLARVTVRPNPAVGDQSMEWSLLGDFNGTGPLDGATTNNGVLIIVSATGGYKLITDGQKHGQWQRAWSDFAVPAGCTAWGTDVSVFAIATDGIDVQVFARRTSAPWYIYVNETNDDGATWNGWVNIGTSTYTNGAANYVIGAAVLDTVFLRHYEATGVCVEVFNNLGAIPWIRYELETNLQLTVPPPSGELDVVQYGEIIYVYLGALHRDYPDVYGYRIYLTAFHQGAWDSVDYLIMDDMPGVVDSSESVFGFHIGSIYGLTYDARGVIAPTAEWEDDFEGYSDFWMKVADMEVDEAWHYTGGGPITRSAANIVEGLASIEVDGTHAQNRSAWLLKTMNLTADGRLVSGDDYVRIALYVPDISGMGGGDSVRLQFYSDLIGTKGYYKYFMKADLVNGWNFKSVKKSDFVAFGGGSWANIVYINCRATNGVGFAYFDDWQIARADPGDVNKPNPTGEIWDFPNGEWRIHNEDDDPTRITLGQIDVEAGVGKLAIRHEWPQGNDYQIAVPVRAKRDNGLLGIAFRMVDTTPSSEDGYALDADTTNDLLRLYRFDNGVKTQLDSESFTFNLDTWYYLGVRIFGGQIQGFCSASESTLFNEIRVSATDSTFTTGQVGVMSQDTVARFDSFTISIEAETELRKALHLASAPDIWPSPVICGLVDCGYPRERVVYLGDYWYSFDESDPSFIVVQASSPTGSGADELCPAETIRIHLPLILKSATSAQADVTLSNVYGEFDDSEAIQEGSEIQIEGGYKWYAGEELAFLFTGIINRITESFENNSMKIMAYDFVYKLKKWRANRLFIFRSQFKIWLNLTLEDAAKHLVSIVEGFTYDSTNDRYRSNAAATENMVLHGEYFNDVVVEARAYFVDSFTSAWMGIILRSDSTGDNCYGVLWNYAANTISIRKKTAGAWGGALASVALNAYHSASLWIRSEVINDIIYVWTSADGVTWTYRILYTDTSPLSEGHTGFAAYPAAGLSVDLRGFTIYAFDTEKTVEYLMRQIATMAGVLSFNFENEIYDDFSQEYLDVTRWRTSETTLGLCDAFWGRLRCAGGAGAWGYLNSMASRKSFVLDFRASVESGSRAAIVFRANTGFTQGYRLEIRPGAVGTARILLYTLDGNLVKDIYPRVAISAGTGIDYILSIQDNFDQTQTFISLWMGKRLIFSCFDNTYPLAGYVGVGSYGVNINYFDNFSIGKLDTPVISKGQANYFVINVGESGDKLIEELASVQSARWLFAGDGTFTAGLLEPGEGVADILDPMKTIITLYEELYVGSKQRDDDGWISHVRVVANNGIYADSYDSTLLSQKGYRFERINVNADLSAAQCQEIGEKYLEQQQKTGDTFTFKVTPAQLGLTRRMRFHAHAHKFFKDPTSPLKIDRDFIVGSQQISMQREPSPDWDMQIEPEEA